MEDLVYVEPVGDNPTTSIVLDNTAPCAVCGKPTTYIDYCAEVRFCSKTCQNAFFDEIFGKESSR